MLRLMLRRVMSSRVVLVVYVVVGLLVAQSHHYFAHLNDVKSVGSALLAVLLWPLILLGISLHIK